MSVLVKDVMSTQLIWVKPEMTALTVSQLMAKRDIGSVLVRSNEQFVGIITEQDIIRKVVAAGQSAERVTAESLMSYPIATVEQDIPLDDARQKMHEEGIRHLLVTAKETPVGMISIRTWP